MTVRKKRPEYTKIKKGVPSVYIFEAGPFIKIGYSIDTEKRIKGVQTGCPFKVVCNSDFRFMTSEAARMCEINMHRHFHEYRKNGEWFDASILEEAINLAKHYQEIHKSEFEKDRRREEYYKSKAWQIRKKVEFCASHIKEAHLEPEHKHMGWWFIKSGHDLDSHFMGDTWFKAMRRAIRKGC